MKENAVIVMAKVPKVGFTKTRLTPPLSPLAATKLYEALLQDTISLVSSIESVALALAVSPPDETDYFEQICPPETIFIPLTCQNIGECQSLSIRKLLDMGYSNVFTLNGDGPSLPKDYIEQAVEKISTHDIVLGPSTDGGYYLIGMKKHYEEVFQNIQWSTKTVFDETIAITNERNLSVSKLPTWYDVDTIEDIERLRNDLDKLPKNQLVHTRNILNSGIID